MKIFSEGHISENKISIFSFLAVFALMLMLSLHDVFNFDIWLHLKAGADILLNRAVPYVDTYSAYVAGNSWFDHEWLTQVLFSLVYSCFGSFGLVVLKTTFLLSAYLMVYLIAERFISRQIILLLIFFSLLLSEHRLLIRPEMLSLFFLSCYLYVFAKAPDGKQRLIYWLVPLQLVWVNVHGYSFFGIAIVFIFFLSQLLQRRFFIGRSIMSPVVLDEIWLKRLFVVTLFVVGVSFCNPYGSRSVMYPLSRITSVFYGQHPVKLAVAELRPFYNMYNSHLKRLMFHLLFLSAGVSFIFNLKRLRLDFFLIFCAVSYMGFTMVRHVPMFALVCSMVAGYNFDRFFVYGATDVKSSVLKFVRVFLTLLLFVVVFVTGWRVVWSGYIFDKFLPNQLGFGVATLTYPKDAMAFLKDEGLMGDVFGNFSLGGYIIYSGDRKIKPIIDGRTELYEDGFFSEYIVACSDAGSFAKFADKYDINTVLLHYMMEDSDKPLEYLLKSNDWSLVYLDDAFCIFLRRDGQYAAEAQQLQLDADSFRFSPTVRYMGIFKRPFPVGYVNMGIFFTKAGLYRKAIDVYEEGLKKAPDSADLYHEAATLYSLLGEYEEAINYFEKALFYDDSNIASHYNLAVCYRLKGENEKAAAEIKKVKKMDKYFKVAPVFNK